MDVLSTEGQFGLIIIWERPSFLSLRPLWKPDPESRSTFLQSIITEIIVGMRTSFHVYDLQVTCCATPQADTHHTEIPFPTKHPCLIQGCVRMMLWEWVRSIEQPVTAQYEVCLLPPLSVAYANQSSGRGVCVCVCVFSGVSLWESEGANPECFTGEERTIQSPAPPVSPPHHYNSLHATSQDKDVVFSLCIKVPSHPTPRIHTNTLMLNTCFCTHTSRWCRDMIKSHAPIYRGSQKDLKHSNCG